MNQFTHRHINSVGACEVNHMWSPVTLQEFLSRMHDKWMETHCWLKLRQLRTCDYQKTLDTLSFLITWCLKHFADCPCVSSVYSRRAYSLTDSFSPFCPLCIFDKLAHSKGVVKTSTFIKYGERCRLQRLSKGGVNGRNKRSIKKMIDRVRKEIWALCSKGQ